MLAVSLTGCDPFASPDSMMDEYLSRLARVLNVEKQQTALEPVRLIPSVRDRRAEIPKIDITVLEFLSLYGCELQVVVALAGKEAQANRSPNFAPVCAQGEK
uniref:DUF3080 family protein n=1 Tax=Methylophaga thiooxydans TaxID=392484 RepID=UPI0023534E00